MSHDYHVRCLCGETSSEWNVKPEILVGAVKQSAVLRPLRESGWGSDISELQFLGFVLPGLAVFLCSHFDHGGFEVVGEYKTDVPIPCRPEMDVGDYQATCLARIREEIAAIEQKLERLKTMSMEGCDFFTPPETPCTLPAGHAGVHLTIKEQP